MLRHLQLKKEIKKSNKLMFFRVGNKKLLEKYKATQTKIEDLKKKKTVYSNRYIIIKIRIYGDKVYTNFRDFGVPEDGIECESFIVTSINSLLVYDNKYYLQVYIGNCAYNILNKQMTDYRNENLFEDQILQMLYYYKRIYINEGIDLIKSNNNKEYMIYHQCFLIMDSNFKIMYAMVAII